MNLCKRYVIEFANDVCRKAEQTGNKLYADWMLKQCDRIVNYAQRGLITNIEAARNIGKLEEDFYAIEETLRKESDTQ